MQGFAQPCVWDRARFVTHRVVFVFPLRLVACRNCSRAGPLPCWRWYEDRDLPRKVGKWKRKLHILLGKLALDWCNIDREPVPNNATLVWWLIMRTSRKRCRRRVELAGEAECFFWSFVFFYLAPSLIFLIHVTRNKEKTHCGLTQFHPVTSKNQISLHPAILCLRLRFQVTSAQHHAHCSAIAHILTHPTDRSQLRLSVEGSVVKPPTSCEMQCHSKLACCGQWKDS